MFGKKSNQIEQKKFRHATQNAGNSLKKNPSRIKRIINSLSYNQIKYLFVYCLDVGHFAHPQTYVTLYAHCSRKLQHHVNFFLFFSTDTAYMVARCADNGMLLNDSKYFVGFCVHIMCCMSTEFFFSAYNQNLQMPLNMPYFSVYIK